MLGSVASARQQKKQMEAQARLRAEHADHQWALEVAKRHGSITVALFRGRYFALIDGESRIPKVKRRATS